MGGLPLFAGRTMSEASQILLAAADAVVEPRRWAMCVHPAPNCPCAIGHIELVTASAAGIAAAHAALRELLGGSVTAFNNVPGQTAANVALMMRAAAANVS